MNIGVSGAAGAMGKRVTAEVAERDDFTLVAALERPDHPKLGEDAGLVAGVGRLGVPLSDELAEVPQVMVDFSAPEATVDLARACAAENVPVVIGTTGLSDEAKRIIRDEVAARVPVLVAPNMSLGVNLLFRLAETAAEALPAGYDVEIVEAHHRRKKDAPSGTAKELAGRLLQVLDRHHDVLLHGRKGVTGERTGEEIAIHAVRGGDIVGDHTVMFAGTGERLELTHRASSRDVFVRGALLAAQFVVEHEHGLYSMQDVLA